MKKLKLVLVLLACVFGSLWSFDASASKTIYFVNEAYSGGAKVYGFNGDGTDDWNTMKNGSYAPVHTQKWNGKTVYKFTHNYNRANVIFYWNDNGDKQTVDGIAMTDGALYVIQTTTDNGKYKVEIADANYNGGFTEPASLSLQGWKHNSSTISTISTGGTKNADGKYILNVDLSDNYGNFFFVSSSNRFVPNKDSGNENVTAGTTTYSAKAVDANYTAQQFSFAQGTYTVTAWFEDEILKFTVADNSTPTPGPGPVITPGDIKLNGYLEGGGNTMTEFPLTKGSNDRYTATVTLNKTYYFWMESDGTVFGSNTNGAGENCTTGIVKTTVNKGTDNSYRYNIAAGTYNVTAYWDNDVVKFSFAKQTSLPSTITVRGYMQGNSAVSNFTLTKGADNKYTGEITLDKANFYFWLIANSVNYTSNWNENNRTVTAGATEWDSYKNGNADSQRFCLAKGTNGVYNVTAWFDSNNSDKLLFTITESTNEVALLPTTILVQGYKPNSGTWYTFATLTKNAQGRYPFSVNVSDAEWYKFVFVCNNSRYCPDRDSDNDIVKKGDTYSTRKKAFTYNEQQFQLNRGSYSGEAWFEDGVICFKFNDNGGGDITVTNRPTIYMFFVNDMHQEAANRDNAPKVTFFDTQKTDGADNMVDDGDIIATRDMVKVTGYGLTDDYDLYKYEFNDVDIRNLEAGDIVDATFWFPNKSGNNNYYTCGHVFSDRDWDQDHWLDYIYVTDSDNHAGQSYMTFDEWAALRSREHSTLYLLGQGFQEFTEAGAWDITSSKMLTATATMGVFYPEFTWETQDTYKDGNGKEVMLLTSATFNGSTKKGATFKMSYINPHEWYTKHPHGTAQNATRSWMTFNLGCVGYDVEEVERDPTLAAAINTQISNPGQNVLIEQANTLPNNNYNQYNWFLEKPDNAQDMTLIVDLDGECESVTLLPFRCQPSVTTSNVTVKTFRTDRSADTWEAPVLEAEYTNGLVLFNYVNVASAIGTVTGFRAYDLNTHRYDVSYEFYADGISIGKYDPKLSTSDYSTDFRTYQLGFEAIPFGDGVNVGVRAKFTDRDTKMTFHSKYFANPITLTGNVVAPTFSLANQTYTDGSNFLYEMDNDGNRVLDNHGRPIYSYDDPRYTLNGQVDAFVTAPANTDEFANVAWYADFRSEVNAASWNDSHHLNHPQHANGGEILGLNHTPLLEPTFADYDDEASNWSHHLGYNPANGMNDTWKIMLPEIVEVKRNYGADGYSFTETGVPAKMTVDVKIAAVYPFLIDNDAQLEVVSAPTAAPREADAEETAYYEFKSGHNYSVYNLRREAPVQTYDLTSDNLTGVKDIVADGIASGNADAPVEYFNLQGIRVNASDLAPGVYIRRQGTATEKMIIR